jgi:hypothetical protein
MTLTKEVFHYSTRKWRSHFPLLIDKRKCSEREFEAKEYTYERRHARSPPLRLFYLLQHHWHLFLIDRQEKVH